MVVGYSLGFAGGPRFIGADDEERKKDGKEATAGKGGKKKKEKNKRDAGWVWRMSRGDTHRVRAQNGCPPDDVRGLHRSEKSQR